jgi:hypothetical protein
MIPPRLDGAWQLVSFDIINPQGERQRWGKSVISWRRKDTPQGRQLLELNRATAFARFQKNAWAAEEHFL